MELLPTRTTVALNDATCPLLSKKHVLHLN